jgi:hypothetical protein
VRFVNEPTAVNIQFEIDGTVRPRRFFWNHAWLDVSDIGRQWIDAKGRHVLVMVDGRYTYELLMERESLSWRVVRAPHKVSTA